MKIVPSDASPIFTLARAGELGLLRAILPEIVVPPTVYHEIVTQGAGRAGAAEIASGDWVQVHALGQPLTGIDPLLGAGEREAIALARELNLQLVIDERSGRREARRLRHHLPAAFRGGVFPWSSDASPALAGAARLRSGGWGSPAGRYESTSSRAAGSHRGKTNSEPSVKVFDSIDPDSHAAKRMRRRGVSLEAATFVLNEADTDLPAEIPGARKLSATYEGRRFTVVALFLRVNQEGHESLRTVHRLVE